ncbi:3-keto-5-aminohexanoate cleavage protein [Streptosporangium sp. NPDC002607]
MTAATLITVAPTGAEADKTRTPALPVTLDELVATAVACEQAGAAVIHVHIRDDDARPTLDLPRLQDTVAALRAHTSRWCNSPPAARSPTRTRPACASSTPPPTRAPSPAAQ